MIAMLQKLLMPPPPKFHGVMGIYHYVDDAADVVKTLRQAGHKQLRVFSPVPHHEIEQALEQGPSIVRWVTFVGGLLGFTGGLSLSIYSCIAYPLVVGGKELVSLPPYMIISYESMILLAGLTNLLGMMALARIPEIRPAAPYDPRFSEDRIGIWVPCGGDDVQRVESLLRGHAAEEVQVHA
jgi:hypothetical protein